MSLRRQQSLETRPQNQNQKQDAMMKNQAVVSVVVMKTNATPKPKKNPKKTSTKKKH